MYEVLYQGVDTLDIAFKGAFPDTTLKEFDAAAEEARTTNQKQPLTIGPGNVQVLVKGNGRSGGYRYVFDTGPTGANFAVKANTDLQEWNLFVSIGSLCLLTLGYQGAKARLHNTLADMGFRITDLSVNRIDYAVDILAPGFTLDVQNFIMPGQAKARPYWSKERKLDDAGNRPKAVIRGRKFESVTIGTMPNRQVIVYDKRRAAIDQRQPYWFEAWGIDKDDPGAQVWRVEIRGGRDALAKRHLKRSYEAIEHDLQHYLLKAASEIRYVTDKHHQKNVSRSTTHPLWKTVTDALNAFPASHEPQLPEARALRMIAEQRKQMARKQAFGNLQNVLVLDGLDPSDVAQNFPAHATQEAKRYLDDIGADQIARKTTEIGNRLCHLQSDFEDND